MNYLQKLSCFHRHEPIEIAHPYQDTLPPPKPVLAPAKTPSRFPTNIAHNAEPSKPRSRITSQAPRIPPDLFTNPTVRVVSPTPELEGDNPPSTSRMGEEIPKSPSSWLTTASDGSAGSAVLGAEQESGRVPGGDLRTLPSVRVTMHDEQGEVPNWPAPIMGNLRSGGT